MFLGGFCESIGACGQVAAAINAFPVGLFENLDPAAAEIFFPATDPPFGIAQLLVERLALCLAAKAGEFGGLRVKRCAHLDGVSSAMAAED